MSVELKKTNYKYGFVTKINSDTFDKGLNEDTIRAISNKKNEPKFLLDYRLEAFSIWKKMKEPSWAHLNYPKIDYQNISYYSAPKSSKKDGPKSLDEVDPELLKLLKN